MRSDALVLPIDYSTSVGAELANSAELLASDDPDQLAAVAQLGHFVGWRELDGPVGAGSPTAPRPVRQVASSSRTSESERTTPSSRKAILDQAEALGRGTLLAE